MALNIKDKLMTVRHGNILYKKLFDKHSQEQKDRQAADDLLTNNVKLANAKADEVANRLSTAISGGTLPDTSVSSILNDAKNGYKNSNSNTFTNVGDNIRSTYTELKTGLNEVIATNTPGTANTKLRINTSVEEIELVTEDELKQVKEDLNDIRESLKLYLSNDIVSENYSGSNTFVLENLSSSRLIRLENCPVDANKKHKIHIKISSRTTTVYYLGFVKYYGGTWLNESVAKARVKDGDVGYIDVEYTPSEKAYIAIRVDATANANIDIYAFDVTNIPEGIIEKIKDFEVKKISYSESVYSSSSNHSDESDKADVSILSETTKAIYVDKNMLRKHETYQQGWFAPIGFFNYVIGNRYIFFFDTVDGVTESSPFGWMNNSGAWAEMSGASVKLDDNLYYSIGTVPENADMSRSAYIVMRNTKIVETDVIVFDITDIEIDDDTAIALYNSLKYESGIGYLDIIKNMIKSKPTGRWFGKNVLVIGDSLTAARQWQTQLTSLLGMNVTTHAKGGMGLIQCVDGESGAPPFDPDSFNAGTLYPLNEYDVYGKDLIVFFAGYNNRGTADGSVGDCYAKDGSGQQTIAGMMQYCINRIYEELGKAGNYDCRLLIVTVDCAGKYPYIDADGYTEYPSGSGRTMETLANIQKSVANHNSIPCVDLWHNSGINKYTWSVFGSEPNAYYEDTTGRTGTYPHNGDQLHKSAKGYRRIGECVVGGIINAYGS